MDTHIFVWWADRSDRLTPAQLDRLDELSRRGEVLLNRISLWEIAKLVEYGNLKLDHPVEDWLERAMETLEPKLISLTREIVVDSTELPGNLETNDPADQIIVATARRKDAPLATEDGAILGYDHVGVFDW